MKKIVDAWYNHNLTNIPNKIEDAIYCNARDISNLGGWDPNGGQTNNNNITFKNYTLTTDLSCSNITDQFAVGNNLAKLTYPIGLLQDEERQNINSKTLMKSNDYTWTISPYYFQPANGTFISAIKPDGSNYYASTWNPYAIRPVISIKNNAVILSGSGSEADPWIVE